MVVAHTVVTFAVGWFAGRWSLRRRARAGAIMRIDSGGGAGDAEARRMSSLREPGRSVAVVTTAALPWRTGTSVNPLLRAAHLATDSHRKVVLVVPWLEEADQRRLFPAGTTFATREEHAAFILREARQRTQLPCEFKVLFYDGKYFAPLGSILPVGDITAAVPPELADVAILEEPEHLNWCQHKTRWTDRYNHVVGIMHTNYLAYIADGPGPSGINVAALARVNKWVTRIHTHKVIKLSDAVQPLPRQVTCNVHGVGGNFLAIGRGARCAAGGARGARRFSKGAYFIGKAVWGKGYRELIDLMAAHGARVKELEAARRAQRLAARDAALTQELQRTQEEEGLAAAEAAALASAAAAAAAAAAASPSLTLGRAAAAAFGTGLVHLDVYGSGEDLAAIQSEAASSGVEFEFHEGRDHADEALHEYQVFVNPSTSDVVATTTAEALAMGKWVVVGDIACNAFFKQFPNCLVYSDAAGFSDALVHALSHEPAPMDDDALAKLSWEAATERLLDVSEITPREWPSRREARFDKMLWRMYRSVTGFAVLRQALGLTSTTPDDKPTDDDADGGDERYADWELWADLTSLSLQAG